MPQRPPPPPPVPDVPCDKVVPPTTSGYCECSGGRKMEPVGKDHPFFNCKAECAKPVPACDGWKATAAPACVPDGVRVPANDLPCSAVVPYDASGYCLCRGIEKKALSNCNHDEFTCADICTPPKLPAEQEGILDAIASGNGAGLKQLLDRMREANAKSAAAKLQAEADAARERESGLKARLDQARIATEAAKAERKRVFDVAASAAAAKVSVVVAAANAKREAAVESKVEAEKSVTVAEQMLQHSQVSMKQTEQQAASIAVEIQSLDQQIRAKMAAKASLTASVGVSVGLGGASASVSADVAVQVGAIDAELATLRSRMDTARDAQAAAAMQTKAEYDVMKRAAADARKAKAKSIRASLAAAGAAKEASAVASTAMAQAAVEAKAMAPPVPISAAAAAIPVALPVTACISWRGKDGSSLPCETSVPGQSAGYCECSGRIVARSNAGHPPFTCAAECLKPDDAMTGAAALVPAAAAAPAPPAAAAPVPLAAVRGGKKRGGRGRFAQVLASANV